MSTRLLYISSTLSLTYVKQIEIVFGRFDHVLMAAATKTQHSLDRAIFRQD